LTAEIGRQNFLNSLYIYITPSNQHFKASRCLNSILRQVFFINFSRGIQISQFESHERLFICLFFMISLLFIFIPIYVYLCIYTPSYQHFKAFPVSKFNSETSFLYQLFKENSNFIVKKPCKVICLSAYDVFVFYITLRQGYLFVYVL